MKNIVISTDVGFNGIKVIVGTEEKELFNFHTDSDVFEVTNLTSVGSGTNLEDTIYVKEESSNTKKTFVVGKAAKEYLTTPDAKKQVEEDTFYTMGDTEEEGYKRFFSASFKKLHLAVIYRAVNTLSHMKDYSDILSSSDKYKLHIKVELPHSIYKDSSYLSVISGNIKQADERLMFKTHLDGTYNKLPQLINDAEISFMSQVIAAVICELDSNEELNTPVFALDCGGNTIGIAMIENTMQVADGATSNRDYAVNNINAAAVQQIMELTDNELELDINQVEEIAMSKGADSYKYWSDKQDKSVSINIKEVYAKAVVDTAKKLAAHCFDRYKRDIGRCNTILIAGGTGEIYYKTLKKEFEKKLDAAIILAEGEVTGTKNGSIFAVCAGGFKLAAMEIQEE